MKNRLYLILLTMVCAAAQAQTTVTPQSSDIASAPTLYLDFNGQYVSGTPWNWDGPINAAPSGLSAAQINEIFLSVAADYRVFRVNVTTDSSKYLKAPPASRMRVIVTTSSSWYGSTGGVAYIGSFTWGDDTPCWVFSALLKYNTKNIAEAISHELGHTLGLQHQSVYDKNCVKVNEYNSGGGDYTTGWSPIMGVSYYTNASTWMKGRTTVSCSTIQDDMATIAGSPNNLYIRTDDIGDSYRSAKTLSQSSGIYKETAIISTPGDRDAFSFNLPALSRVNFEVLPESAGDGDKYANLNVRLSLLNRKGDTIKRINPDTTMRVSLDTSLKAGTYYLLVEGGNSAKMPDYGSVGRYTITGSATAAAMATTIQLQGRVAGSQHLLSWSIDPEMQIHSIDLHISSDGKNFRPLQNLSGETRSYHYQPAKGGRYYYQLSITDSFEEVYYSPIITLSNQPNGKPLVIPHPENHSLVVRTDEAGSFEIIDPNGRYLQQGRLLQGSNQVVVGSLRGLYFIRIRDNSGTYTHKFIFP